MPFATLSKAVPKQSPFSAIGPFEQICTSQRKPSDRECRSLVQILYDAFFDVTGQRDTVCPSIPSDDRPIIIPRPQFLLSDMTYAAFQHRSM